MNTERNVIEISKEDLSRIIRYWKKLTESLIQVHEIYVNMINKGMGVGPEKIKELETDKIWLSAIGEELREIARNMKIGENDLKMVYSLMRDVGRVAPSLRTIERSPKDLLKEELEDKEEYFMLTREGPPEISHLKKDFQGIKIFIPTDIWRVLQKEINNCQKKRLEGFYELLGFEIGNSIVITAFYKPGYTKRTSNYLELSRTMLPLSSVSDTHKILIFHVHPVKGPSRLDLEGTMGMYNGYFLVVTYDDKIEDICEGEMYEMPVKSRDELKEKRYKIILF